MSTTTRFSSLAAVLLLGGLTACAGEQAATQPEDPPTASAPSTPSTPEASTPAPSTPTTPESSAPATMSSESPESPESPEPSETESAERERVQITIESFEYSDPGPVPPGARIRVENLDDTVHTVTAEGGGFDLTIPPGETARFTAPSQPGEYAYVCSFHADMSGTLVVS